MVRETLSHSEVEQYKKCRRKHYYRYIIGIRSISATNAALNKGLFGHAVLEAYFKALVEGSSKEDARNKSKRVLVDLFMQNIAKEYPTDLSGVQLSLDTFFNADPFGDHKILAAESDYKVHIGIIDFIFRVDLMTEGPDGKIRIFDFKFLYTMLEPAEVALYPQLPLYMEGLTRIGIQVEELWYIQMRSRTVKNPTEEDLLLPVKVETTDTRRKTTFREHLVAGEEILLQRQRPIGDASTNAIRSQGRDCNMCEFKRLCVAEMEGSNVNEILNDYYTKEH